MNGLSEGYVISIDLGTSSVRACLVNRSLKMLFQSQRPVSLETDRYGKAVQDAENIIDAGLNCIAEVLDWAEKHSISPDAVSFSNAVASLVCLDEQYHPLEPALTYIDSRAHEEADSLLREYGSQFFRTTATPMHASYWLPKFVWLKNKQTFTDTRFYCTIKDLFIYRLTGQFVTDYSNAVATGLCNVTTGDWDERLLNIAGINKDQLPEIKPTTSVLDFNPSVEMPELTQVSTIKIVLGANDGVLSSLGAGAFKPGQVTSMIGSSGACRIAASSPLITGESLMTWSYPLDEGIWIRGGAMNNGGLVTQWLVENFSTVRTDDDEAYDDLFAAAELVEPGSKGLIFLPYLFGERAPIYDERARGVFFGLTSSHHRGHFARAGLEGILFAMYSIFEIIKPEDVELEVIATGGYLRSALMLQIQSDIFGVPIKTPSSFEGSSIGAAALGLKALGIIDSFDEIESDLLLEKTYLPDLVNHRHYQQEFIQFKQLYASLKPMFASVGSQK